MQWFHGSDQMTLIEASAGNLCADTVPATVLGTARTLVDNSGSLTNRITAAAEIRLSCYPFHTDELCRPSPKLYSRCHHH